MAYRVEIATTARAGCQATHCKSAGVKIQKGELRQGVMVDYQGNQSMKYRHWGCVTPQVLHNWNESAEGDMELIDGYDGLPADVQEIVKTALEVGHVDDETWNGDVECNRYTGKRSAGMFLKGKAKAAKEAADAEDDDAPVEKKTTKKRARKDVEDDDAEERPVKKHGKKAAAAADEDGDVEAAPKAKKGRGKKVKAEDQNDDIAAKENAEDEMKPAPMKRGKKAAAADDENETKPVAKKRGKKGAAVEDDEADEAAPAPKRGRGKKVKAVTKSDEIAAEESDAPKSAATKKGRSKKAVAQSSDTLNHDEEEDVGTAKAPAKKGRGRSKRAAATGED